MTFLALSNIYHLISEYRLLLNYRHQTDKVPES